MRGGRDGVRVVIARPVAVVRLALMQQTGVRTSACRRRSHPSTPKVRKPRNPTTCSRRPSGKTRVATARARVAVAAGRTAGALALAGHVRVILVARARVIPAAVAKVRHAEVNDLRNADFVPIDPASDIAYWLKTKGEEVPRWVSQQELTDLLRRRAADEGKDF